MDVFTKLKNTFGIYSFKGASMLKDGTQIVIDGNLEVGVLVYVITTDGNIPLPSGEYELETGEILVVEDGTIVDILEKVEDVPVDEPDVPVDAVDEPIDEPETPSTDIVDLEIRITALEEALATLLSSQDEVNKENEELKKERNDFSEQIKHFEEKLEKMDGAYPLIKRKIESDDTNIKLSQTTSKRLKNLGLLK